MTTRTAAAATTALPAAGSWAIDPGHAEVAFIGRHFMLLPTIFGCAPEEQGQHSWDTIQRCVNVTPLTQAFKLKTRRQARIHVFRNVVEKCWDQLTLTGCRITELCLAACQLPHWVELAHKQFAPLPENSRGLGKKCFQVFDMFQNQHRYDDVGRGISERPL